MSAARTERLPAALITTSHEVYDADEGRWVRVTGKKYGRSGGVTLQLADGSRFVVTPTFNLDTREADRA